MCYNTAVDIAREEESALPLSKELLDILACPACDERPPLKQVSEDYLECEKCGRRYPIRDGIIELMVEPEEPSNSTN